MKDANKQTQHQGAKKLQPPIQCSRFHCGYGIAKLFSSVTVHGSV
jgi:hypothetical protein